MGDEVDESFLIQIDDHAAHRDHDSVAAGENQRDVTVFLPLTGGIGKGGLTGQEQRVGIFVVELEQPQGLRVVKFIQCCNTAIAGVDPIGGAVDKIDRFHTIDTRVDLLEQLCCGQCRVSGRSVRKQNVRRLVGLVHFIIGLVGRVQNVIGGSVSLAQGVIVAADRLLRGLPGQINGQHAGKNR